MSLKTRIAALEAEPTSCEEKRILELWQQDWTDGVFDYITPQTWEPGKPAIKLAGLAWIHHKKHGNEHLRKLDFEQFWEVFVRGIDPAFL